VVKRITHATAEASTTHAKKLSLLLLLLLQKRARVSLPEAILLCEATSAVRVFSFLFPFFPSSGSSSVWKRVRHPRWRSASA